MELMLLKRFIKPVYIKILIEVNDVEWYSFHRN